MSNPNPRVQVHRTYAVTVNVGDIVALNGMEEAQVFIDGIGGIIRSHFEDAFVAASFAVGAQQAIFVFKHLRDAKQCAENWRNVVSYYEAARKA